MDAVILAGGRGTRMGRLAPPFHKPILEVNGVPLVRQAVELALGARVAVPVVVVAPENAADVAHALDGLAAALIIQREPRGPGDALRVGLQVVPSRTTSDRVLVLLSDNVTIPASVAAVADPWNVTAVGVRQIRRAEAVRYTRWEDGRWVEKVPFDDPDGPPAECWVGPFVGWRSHMERVLDDVCAAALEVRQEAPIGPYLSRFMRNPDDVIRVPVSSYDVGTVEAYRQATEGEKL